MGRYQGLIGVVVLLAIAWLLSNNRRKISLRVVLWGLTLQFAFAFLTLRTDTGQCAFLHVSCSEWKNLFSLEIYGRVGKLAIDGLGGSYGVERLTWYRMLPEMGPPETTAWEYPRGDQSWALEFAAFAEDIRAGRQPEPGLPAARAALEVVDTIYARSAAR